MTKFWSKMVQRATPYVPGKQIDGVDILKLNTNENPYPPSPKVIDAIETEMKASLQLYPSPTVDSLRETVGELYDLSADHVFVGNGSDEVLAFSFMAFFEHGEEIVFPKITYSFYEVYATLFDVPYKLVELERDFTIPVEQLFQAEGGVIFPNPNAPTSLYMTLDSVREVIEQNPNKVVIVDEAYVDFADKSAVSLINDYDNLLVIQTTSKSRALAGLRVGFALGQPHLIDALVRIKDSMNSYTIDRLALVGAKAAIKDVYYTRKRVDQIIETRKWAQEKLREMGFCVLPSQTNFLFAEHYSYDGAILQEKLQEMNVLIRHFNVPPIENYLRITIGTDEQMTQFFEKLQQAMDQM